jgi:hypothetical protein
MRPFVEPNRQSRIDRYYQAEHPAQLAEWLVDAEDRIARLEEDSDRLARLEAAGIDNWEGYSSAFRDDSDDEWGYGPDGEIVIY